MRSFQPTDLEYFIEICRFGSIAQAAKHLGVSQPALSKAIRRLEQIAGARLLDRNARGVNPTEMGRILVQRASLILYELDATRSVLQEMSGVRTGSVSMGVPPTLNHGFIPDMVELACQQRPKLHFRVSEGLFQSLIPRLRLGELDFIISSPTPAEALATDLRCEPLGSNLFVACVGADHPLAKLDSFPDEALHEYGWVLVPPPGVLRDQLDHLFQQRGLQALEPQVETSSTVLSKALITRQNFIGFLPLEVFAAEEQAGLIQRLSLPWLYWRRELTLVSRRSRALTPAAEYMVELIRHEAATRLERPPQPRHRVSRS
ncbi:LysR family transcriptional regulator [Pusillimonas sp.]|uniref:LysR family transcriptional regulator n=1 Tax=Pusillimonas sp. TaxID=3040095 RepID=UPI0037CBBFEE